MSETQLSFVKQKLIGQLGFFRNRRDFNRRMAFWFTIIPAGMAATSTVSVGVAETLDLTWPLVVALVSGGLATVLGAWDALFSNRKLWVVNNVSLAGFQELSDDIEYREADTTKAITQAEVDTFYDRYKAIVEKAEKSWQATNSR